MADEHESAAASDERKPISLQTLAGAGLLLVLFGFILFGSLRGCVSEDPQQAAKRLEEQKKKEEEEKKKQEALDDPKILEPVVLPNEPIRIEQPVKPGHWALASQQMTAKLRDFIGRTRTTVNDEEGRYPLPLERTPFTLQSTRPAALAKGTTKNIETTFFVPQSAPKLTLSTTIEEGGLGMSRRYDARLISMFPHQYHFVVLAAEPDRYAILKTLDSVKVPFAGIGSEDAMIPNESLNSHYYVDLLDISRGVPLPDSPLLWTSIAYVLWDEVDPATFTPGQESAMIDWLHWGGQLIVNGPDSLDLMKGSFLEPYLPATSGGPREIAAEDLERLNDNWLISTSRTPGQPLAPTAPWSGITLVPTGSTDASPSTPKSASLYESTGGLLAERSVGRGRIVVSAMQLTERDLVNWRSGFESWFNACLLRRAPRIYRPGPFGGRTLLWDSTADPSLADRRLDARLTSRLHYFVRDLGVPTNYRYQAAENAAGQAGGIAGGQSWTAPANTVNLQAETAYRPPAGAGSVGAWNDFSVTANAAREALREAAGVDVPSATFVVACLAAYLIVLVPLNWLVFHMLGRVEWAWIAAPLIAVASTFVVVHQAQLDIGFVRSQTEIGLLELQPDYSRGHLARYTALYTSLSSTYNLEFDDATALAMPFPRDANDATGRSLATVDFQRQDHVRLSGLPILSNSTNMVHSEQMFALDGPIQIGRSTIGSWQLENHSQLHLRSAALIKKVGDELRGVWIGELEPGRSAAIGDPDRMPKLPRDAPPFAAERQSEARTADSARLNLETLIRLASEGRLMDDGELRLVARVDEPLAGETVLPTASQLRSGTLLVAHLRYGPLPPPQRDRNTKQDVAVADEDELEF